MVTVITVIHVLLTIALIGLVLIQRGKGADMGAAFGSGASATMFGSQGSASFLTRTTAVIAALFFVTSLSLAYLGGQRVEERSVTEMVQPAVTPADAGEGTVTEPEKSDKPDLPIINE